MKTVIPWYLQIQRHCLAGFRYSACLAVLENFGAIALGTEHSGVHEVSVGLTKMMAFENSSTKLLKVVLYLMPQDGELLIQNQNQKLCLLQTWE
jgi:hypothetical protein